MGLPDTFTPCHSARSVTTRPPLLNFKNESSTMWDCITYHRQSAHATPPSFDSGVCARRAQVRTFQFPYTNKITHTGQGRSQATQHHLASLRAPPKDPSSHRPAAPNRPKILHYAGYIPERPGVEGPRRAVWETSFPSLNRQLTMPASKGPSLRYT